MIIPSGNYKRSRGGLYSWASPNSARVTSQPRCWLFTPITLNRLQEFNLQVQVSIEIILSLMFRNSEDMNKPFGFDNSVFQTLKNTPSPLPQPKSYTPIRSRLLNCNEINSTPIAAKLSQRNVSPLLNRILAKENQPPASNLVSKSPSKQSLLRSRKDDNVQLYRPKSPLAGQGQSAVSASSMWKQPPQYCSTPGNNSIKSPLRQTSNKNTSQQQQSMMQSKGFKLLNSKKNSIQLTTPLGLGGLVSKRASQFVGGFPKKESVEEVGAQSLRNLECQYSSTNSNSSSVFNKFKKNFKEQQSKVQTSAEGIMCMNNDNKKAKYQIVNAADMDDETDIYYYCAKCAIHLIQQGFKVQEIITKTSEPEMNQEAMEILDRLNEVNSKISSKQSRVGRLMENNKCLYEEDLCKVDTYYNSLVEAIENMRVKDRETLLSYKNKSEKSIQGLSRNLQEAVSEISVINNQLTSKPDIAIHMQDAFYNRISDYERMLTEQQIIQQKVVNIAQELLQERFQDFVSTFQQNCVVNVMIQQSEQSRQTISFSFQKAKPTDKKISPLQEYIPEEQDRIVSEDQEIIKQAKQPFRNLFPDQSESQSHQNYQQCNSNTDNAQSQSEEQLDDDVIVFCQQTQEIGHSPSFKNI